MASETSLSPFERDLIRLLQRDFPLVSRPFECMAQKLDTHEETILKLLKNWQNLGKLRQISAIFNPSFFRHHSSLFAFKVGPSKLEKAIQVINAHPGVSHNYLRNHEFNLWFTLVVPPGLDLLEEAENLFQEAEAEAYLYLPILKVFKIAAIFNLDEESQGNHDTLRPGEAKGNGEFTERDQRLVKALQEPLPLISEPFKEISRSLGLSEEELFNWIKTMQERGGLRRFAALFKHQKLGFKKNIMVAWQVPEERIDEVGTQLSQLPFITHCYLRRKYPHWPYNLYTMCHFKEKDKIRELSEEIGVSPYLALETLKELKKIRLKLFYH